MKLLYSDQPRLACVLKSGGDYSPENALAMYNMMKRHSDKLDFICLTDMEVDCPSEPLERKWRGWWSVIELFRLVGPVIVTGLDTIIYDNIDKLADIALHCKEDEFYMMKAWSSKREWASGVMVWNGDWSWLTERFNFRSCPKVHVGEQDYTSFSLIANGVEIKSIQSKFKDIYSYKKHCVPNGKPPKGAKLILFHGKPRPHEMEDEWVVENYK